MLNKKIHTLLMMILISFAPLAQAGNNHPADSTALSQMGDCCFRQRVKVSYTQGTCPKGSYVSYAKARNRDFDAPAIWYQCETVQVICRSNIPSAMCSALQA